MAIVIDNFYSHAPRGARPNLYVSAVQLYTFLLTRPSRGATRMARFQELYRLISTHTPLAGRDLLACDSVATQSHFYSHAPRGARLTSVPLLYLDMLNFYSHAPRGARRNSGYIQCNMCDFYSHAPRGARRTPEVLCGHRPISTHTPLAGRDGR